MKQWCRPYLAFKEVDEEVPTPGIVILGLKRGHPVKTRNLMLFAIN